ncbi:MAG: hypothetical protein CSA11_04650 [Chloroflexi bacterium]|nr:MAG: hypothetical protein CSB13_11075 [Chloroflexota bacterium]PIE81287.1 MAG: hypothetical protein CSA11_04650 [Chloroflexota bacterium]
MNTYVEEHFGILTDDNLYLDAILIKPANLKDKKLRVLRVWVPKYPMTKSSVIACARQEVKSYGPDGRIAHLVFDLRGTGDSDGNLLVMNFKMDLHAISEWAKERFGSKVNFGFLGTPTLKTGSVHIWPLRPGAVMETYQFPATSKDIIAPTVIYLSSYGHFGRSDEKICYKLSQAGYTIFGLDPLRYLLHASTKAPLTPEILINDFNLLLQMLPNDPMLIGNPLASGLAMIWASGVERIKGVIAIGRAQSGLQLNHIFDNTHPHTFMLSKKVGNIAPRPLSLIRLENHPMGGHDSTLKSLLASSKEPHRYETAATLTPQLLVKQLKWIQNPS